MFSAIRRRLTYANVAMTLALVFAMSGGAYAAGKVLITSTKQISPKVLKQLKGSAGSKGAAGANGPAGPQGPAGATGAAGKEGAPGKEGATGKEGTAGKEGAPGKDGTTGFTKTLPSNETETGSWAYSFVAGEAEVSQYLPISFAIPLAEELGSSQVHYILANGKEWDYSTSTEVSSTTCLGKVSEPTAVAGNLCIYAAALGSREAFQVTAPSRIQSPSQPPEANVNGAGTSGTVMSWETAKFKLGYGTWAVTAE
ncbi:MAG TPA: hypothetical protein VHY18_11575 [Solirubrobacteraceae bacterium]|nr:hypothetical protein [Solirubrobacteraceae bacterium]